MENKNIDNGIFSNFWQADGSKHLFFNVDVCEEVTERIKNDEKFAHCLKQYPNAIIGKKANISVSVNDGKPFVLRNANDIGKLEYEVCGSMLLVPLFTKQELTILSKIAKEIRKNYDIYDVINYLLNENMQDASNEILWDMHEALGDILKKRLINCYTSYRHEVNPCFDEIRSELQKDHIDVEKISNLVDKLDNLISNFDNEEDDDEYYEDDEYC